MTGFRNYVYVSRTKVEQYLAQMNAARLSKVSSETVFKTPVFEQKVAATFESPDSPFRGVDTIVSEVETKGLMGDLFDYTPWFRATLPVRALLIREKVFYVGRLQIRGMIPVDFAMQCSLSNHVGIENHRREVESLSSSGMEQKLRLPRVVVTLPSLTSSNHMFAAALSQASQLVETSEAALLSRRMAETEEGRQFFRSKEDYDLHRLYKPTEKDQRDLEKYSLVNGELEEMMRGSFTPLRAGLVKPPTWSLGQSLRNIVRYRAIRRSIGAELVADKVHALCRMYNFREVSQRATTDPESEVLNSIMNVSVGAPENSLEIVGIRLLDGYYHREGYDSERRVILGSPLYIA
jgi:hypothetical protein